MATFLDVTGLQHFSAVFVFLFVLIAVYAILSYMKILGEQMWIHMFIALLIALFVLISPHATRVVQNIAPWFAVLFVFIVLIMISGKMIGDIDMGGLKSIFFVSTIIIVIVGAGVTIRSNITVPGDNETSVDFDRDYSQTSTIIFHPKFMGVILILAIAVFTVALLVSNKL